MSKKQIFAPENLIDAYDVPARHTNGNDKRLKDLVSVLGEDIKSYREVLKGKDEDDMTEALASGLKKYMNEEPDLSAKPYKGKIGGFLVGLLKTLADRGKELAAKIEEDIVASPSPPRKAATPTKKDSPSPARKAVVEESSTEEEEEKPKTTKQPKKAAKKEESSEEEEKPKRSETKAEEKNIFNAIIAQFGEDGLDKFLTFHDIGAGGVGKDAANKALAKKKNLYKDYKAPYMTGEGKSAKSHSKKALELNQKLMVKTLDVLLRLSEVFGTFGREVRLAYGKGDKYILSYKDVEMLRKFYDERIKFGKFIEKASRAKKPKFNTVEEKKEYFANLEGVDQFEVFKSGVGQRILLTKAARTWVNDDSLAFPFDLEIDNVDNYKDYLVAGLKKQGLKVNGFEDTLLSQGITKRSTLADLLRDVNVNNKSATHTPFKNAKDERKKLHGFSPDAATKSFLNTVAVYDADGNQNKNDDLTVLAFLEDSTKSQLPPFNGKMISNKFVESLRSVMSYKIPKDSAIPVWVKTDLGRTARVAENILQSEKWTDAHSQLRAEADLLKEARSKLDSAVKKEKAKILAAAKKAERSKKARK